MRPVVPLSSGFQPRGGEPNTPWVQPSMMPLSSRPGLIQLWTSITSSNSIPLNAGNHGQLPEDSFQGVILTFSHLLRLWRDLRLCLCCVIASQDGWECPWSRAGYARPRPRNRSSKDNEMAVIGLLPLDHDRLVTRPVFHLSNVFCFRVGGFLRCARGKDCQTAAFA